MKNKDKEAAQARKDDLVAQKEQRADRERKDAQLLDHMTDYVDALFTSDSYQHMDDSEIDRDSLDWYHECIRHYDYVTGESMLSWPKLYDFKKLFLNKVASIKLTNRDRKAYYNEDGFTLIELMIVVVIIGILAAIAIPIFATQQVEAIKATVHSDVRNTNTSLATALVKKPTSSNVANLPVEKVASPGNVVTVSGDWQNYTVQGVAPAIDNYCYLYNSATGYSECEAASTPNEDDDDGDNGGTVVIPGGSNAQAAEAARVYSNVINVCFASAPRDESGITQQGAADCYNAAGWSTYMEGGNAQPGEFQKNYSDGYVIHPLACSNTSLQSVQYNWQTVAPTTACGQAVVNSEAITYYGGVIYN